MSPDGVEHDPGLVFVNVVVTDPYGRVVTGLSKDAFSISEDKHPLNVSYFSDEEVPQSVCVVFDVSGSMIAKANVAGDAVVRFALRANSSNQYFIVGFDGQVHPADDWVRGEKDLVAGLNGLGHISPKKYGTALYDAVAAGVEKVSRGPQPRQILIVITDGRDTNSKVKVSRLRDMIRQSAVTVYVIDIVADTDFMAFEQGRTTLDGLAAISGGGAYFPKTKAELNDAFERIRLELHGTYTLGVKPEGAADGKLHKIDVKVRPPETFPRLSARSREGYYAPSSGEKNE